MQRDECQEGMHVRNTYNVIEWDGTKKITVFDPRQLFDPSQNFMKTRHPRQIFFEIKLFSRLINLLMHNIS